MVLGYPFFRAFYTTFDYKKKTVSFAKNKANPWILWTAINQVKQGNGKKLSAWSIAAISLAAVFLAICIVVGAYRCFLVEKREGSDVDEHLI